MSQGNVRNINEILASIEALNAQADDLSQQTSPPDPRQPDMPRSMVAEMAERQADVVLLDEIYWKGGAEGDRAVRPSVAPPKPKPAVNDEVSSDAEFDQMLSALMKDLGRQNRSSASPSAGPPVPEGGPGPAADSLTDLKADIDDLLSPYLDVPAARSRLASAEQGEVKRPADKASEPSYARPVRERPEAVPQDQKRQARPAVGDDLISAVMTEQMKAQIAEFVLQEIKLQISAWIAQNLDKIVEDALRSLPTESRDASRTRSAG